MRNVPSIVPAIIIVLLVGSLMFKPIIQGDRTAGLILLGVVVLAGLVMLIGGVSRAVTRRRIRGYNQPYGRRRRW